MWFKGHTSIIYMLNHNRMLSIPSNPINVILIFISVTILGMFDYKDADFSLDEWLWFPRNLRKSGTKARLLPCAGYMQGVWQGRTGSQALCEFKHFL